MRGSVCYIEDPPTERKKAVIMTTLMARYSSDTKSLWLNSARMSDCASMSEASAVLEQRGYTLVGSWCCAGSGTHTCVFTVLVEECASESHVWPAGVSFTELAHAVENDPILTAQQRSALSGLLHSLDIARNTWDCFPVRYPSFSPEKRNQHLVGTLAALIGRAHR